jgi:lactate dehydrogenase-like 2-hydroxyacid dehydrogenase
MRHIFSHLFHLTLPSMMAQKMNNAAHCNLLLRQFCSCQDKMSKIGINGFGRIGRQVLRAAVVKGATVSRKFRITNRPNRRESLP